MFGGIRALKSMFSGWMKRLTSRSSNFLTSLDAADLESLEIEFPKNTGTSSQERCLVRIRVVLGTRS